MLSFLFTVRRYNFNQFRTAAKDIVVQGYRSVLNVNIFSTRDFGNNIDRATSKYLGKWATRLHMLLFILGLTILTIYTIFTPQTNTKSFKNPSFTSYNQLKQQYGDQLKCSCSVIASKYNQFTQITPVFHQVRCNHIRYLIFNTVHSRFAQVHLSLINGEWMSQMTLMAILAHMDEQIIVVFFPLICNICKDYVNCPFNPFKTQSNSFSLHSSSQLNFYQTTISKHNSISRLNKRNQLPQKHLPVSSH